MKKPESYDKQSSQIAKGIAILWLLFFHLFSVEKDVIELGVEYAPLGQNTFFAIASFGKICVSIFVVITAYGISKEIFSKEMLPIEAYKKAFKRFFTLLINFLVFFVSLIIVFGYYFDLSSVYGEFPQGFAYLLSDALGFADLFGTRTMNDTWWYMALAYEMIFAVPIVAYGAKKIGYGILPIAFLLPFVFSMDYTNTIYFFSIGIGVAAAYGDWFNKLLLTRIPAWVQWIIGIVGTIFAVIIRYNPVIHEKYEFITDALIAVFIIWTAIALFAEIPGVRDTLAFIGKNSLNIFLVHSFFYMIIFRQFIYGFKYVGLIYIALILCSLAYSVVLEYLKKIAIKGYVKIRGKKESHNE